MLAEKASEGDDVTKYFDSLRLEDTIALTTVLSIGHRSTETMDFTRTMRHRCQACKALVTLVG